MDKIFKKLVKGTNFKNGPSSGVFVFRDGDDKEADSGVFDEDSSVVYASGEDFKDYTPLDSFSSLDSLTTDEMMSQRAKFISNSIKSKFNFDKSTPIQRYVIPIMMKGNDVVAVAPTGSGKTLSYLIPILLSKLEDNLSVIIIVPTVELVQQVKSEFVYLTGGENFSIATLEKNMKSFNFSIAVTTPLTLYTLLHTNTINTSMTGLKCLILDECDKLLEEGYSENIEYVMNHLKDFKGIQKASFSSTVQSEVLLLSKSHFNNPIHITIGKENVCCCNVEQELICVTNDKGKLVILKQLINDGKLLPPILVFLQSVNRVNDLYNELSQLNLNVQKFTKQLTLKQRQNIIQKFRIGQIWILLCTDILCRGINFKGVHSIVNYDLPLTPQVYINRVGRAGRGTRRGKSVTFFTINDFKILNHIVQIMKLSKSNVPNYLLTLKNIDIQGLKKLEKNPPTRVNIGPIKKKKKYNKNKSTTNTQHNVVNN